MTIINVNKENFEQEVLQAAGPVLLDFWAAWCGPCKMVAPVLDEIAAENPNITIAKINVDEERGLAGNFRVMSIPTLAVMKNGKLVKTAVGFRPKEDILELLKEEE